jgi:hypothetical protein
MKSLLLIAAGVALVASGCHWPKPLRNPDSIDNATAQACTVSADFASGLHDVHDQGPDSFFNFGVMSRGAMPVLTNLVVLLKTDPVATFTLSSSQILKLRRATPGGLTLVLYPEGIACLSPEIKKTFENEVLRHPYTREDYFRLLKTQEQPALKWTQNVLARE